MANIVTTPSVPVIQSDDFEIQRQKINNMGIDINNLSAGPQFITPYRILNSTTIADYIEYNVTTAGVPAGVRNVILQVVIGTNGDAINTVSIKTTYASTNVYEIASTKAAGNQDNIQTTSQGIVPINSATSSFWMRITSSNGNPPDLCQVKIVGYY